MAYVGLKLSHSLFLGLLPGRQVLSAKVFSSESQGPEVSALMLWGVTVPCPDQWLPVPPGSHRWLQTRATRGRERVADTQWQELGSKIRISTFNPDSSSKQTPHLPKPKLPPNRIPPTQSLGRRNKDGIEDLFSYLIRAYTPLARYQSTVLSSFKMSRLQHREFKGMSMMKLESRKDQSQDSNLTVRI